MKVDQKRQYDALQTLEEQSWAEFKEKTQLEWRLSFGYWTVLVTAIGSILAGKAADQTFSLPVSILVVICTFLLLLHMWFLQWIQKSLGITRRYLYKIRIKMFNIVGLKMPDPSRETWWKQPSLYIQLGITIILLGVLFVLIFNMSQNSESVTNFNVILGGSKMTEIISVVLWVVTLIIGAVTAWVYYRQLKTMQLTTLIPYLESKPVREARAHVMEKRDYIESHPYDENKPWEPELRRAVAEVCAAYNVAGSLARLKKVDSDFMIAHWGDSAKRMNGILSPYIKALRAKEGDRYLEGFVWLAEKAGKS